MRNQGLSLFVFFQNLWLRFVKDLSWLLTGLLFLHLARLMLIFECNAMRWKNWVERRGVYFIKTFVNPLPNNFFMYIIDVESMYIIVNISLFCDILIVAYWLKFIIAVLLFSASTCCLDFGLFYNNDKNYEF